MATFYKGIEYVSNPRERVVYYKNQSFTNTDEGISSVQFRSESLQYESATGLKQHTISGSHYQFADNFLNSDKESQFDGYVNIHRNKFYTSGSVLYIPQQYFGEQIKPKSFTLTDDSTAKQVIIKDDGRGNLFSSNAHNSRSVSSVSSSDNYVGNIHYQSGVVLLTETASWSGSGLNTTDINYSDVTRGSYRVDFNSTQTITQNEIIVKIKSHEFNATGNQSIYKNHDAVRSSEIIENISKSIDDFSPYATGIAFYKDIPSVLSIRTIDTGERTIVSKSYDESYNPIDEYVGDDVVFYVPETEPLMVAKFPRPIKIDSTGDITLIIRYDT